MLNVPYYHKNLVCDRKYESKGYNIKALKLVTNMK